MTRKELINGQTFTFNNEEWCIRNQIDDIREAEVFFEKSAHSWATGFKIWFNGDLIGNFKTFKGMQTRLQKLCEKWNLEENTELAKL